MKHWILTAGLMLLVVTGKVAGYRDPYIGHGPTMPPGPDEPIVKSLVLKDGGPLPDCNPCPWNRAPHGPTMPPGPDEPIR